MNTILVPTDFTNNADTALAFAIALLKKMKGRLLLIHSVEVSAVGTPEGVAILPMATGLVEDSEEALEKQAQKIRLENAFQFEVETFCLFGSLVSQLNEIIRTQAVDLVVMGTGGANTLLRKTLGTNTASVIKAAHCPVLAIPAKATFQGFKKIAYAIDLNGEETVFLKQLFQFAAPFGSEVSFVNVKTDNQPSLPPDYPPLKEITKHYPANSFQLVQLPGKSVVKGLKAFVEDQQMNLLAVSIHDRGFWEQMFHKSVSKALALEAFIPLLALPEEPYQTLPSQWGQGKLKPQPVH
ncbi:MAG: universal stress protein [Rufibacter sp.]